MIATQRVKYNEVLSYGRLPLTKGCHIYTNCRQLLLKCRSQKESSPKVYIYFGSWCLFNQRKPDTCNSTLRVMTACQAQYLIHYTLLENFAKLINQQLAVFFYKHYHSTNINLIFLYHIQNVNASPNRCAVVFLNLPLYKQLLGCLI